MTERDEKCFKESAVRRPFMRERMSEVEHSSAFLIEGRCDQFDKLGVIVIPEPVRGDIHEQLTKLGEPFGGIASVEYERQVGRSPLGRGEFHQFVISGVNGSPPNQRVTAGKHRGKFAESEAAGIEIAKHFGIVRYLRFWDDHLVGVEVDFWPAVVGERHTVLSE